MLASAQEDKPFDCYVSIGELKYDLHSASGEHTASRERDSPPTRYRDAVRFNLCEDLKPQDGIASEDQCPSGTRACLTKTNLKGQEDSRITAVIPIGNSTGVESSRLSSPKGLQLTFHGSSYPSLSSPEPVPQSFTIKLLCSTEESSPQFDSYDGKEVKVEWSVPAACGMGSPPSDDKPSGGDEKTPEEETVGSGIGYFFLLLFLAFVAYFALGAYYNYSTYGATGADLIPHRDFWREVPYMLRDVVSHLCSSFRPGSSSRGGYIAV
ncbi:putative autophagy protein Atg27 [Panus rudis PR-1116 ss-1]|nr:putative autophagy protein Atg27 [Panus rudis PR-1116 ss-1]